MSEKEFQRQVIELAKIRGWRVAHFRPAQTRSGRWVTPVQADGAGFPDLILVRRARLVAAELKVRPNRPTVSQMLWLTLLGDVEGVTTAVWYPEQWAEIERLLE